MIEVMFELMRYFGLNSWAYGEKNFKMGGPSANFKTTEGARLQIFKNNWGGGGAPGPYGRYAYA